ncbi:MAG: aspartate/glutamate racemase family protein [Candidatus Promineifilaceae bacterium]
MIGIVGGVGPYAGLDLQRKILRETVSQSDQAFLAVTSISDPAPIPDRTAYLLGETTINPAGPIGAQLRQLEAIGATVAGIPCNTAHAPQIMGLILEGLAARGSRLRLLHLVQEVGQFLLDHYPAVRSVGLLSTMGTALSCIYPLTLRPMGFEVLTPERSLIATCLQPAIYDPQYGIKANGCVTPPAMNQLRIGIDYLQAQGAEALILGCTELPLAFAGLTFEGLPLIDSTLVLARALIRAEDPRKLRPFSP